DSRVTTAVGMKLLATRSLFLIVKRMTSESSIDARSQPAGCGIRSRGSPSECASIGVSGAETCSHELLLAAGSCGPGTAAPVTTLEQPGTVSNAMASIVPHSLTGNRIAPHHTFVSCTVKYPASARETQRPAPS